MFQPIDAGVLDAILGHFEKTAVLVSSAVAFLFMVRVTYLLITVSDAGSYAVAIRDVVQYFVLIGLFPSLFRFTIQFVGNISEKFVFKSDHHERGSFDRFLTVLSDQNFFLKFLTTLFPVAATSLVQVISTILLTLLVAIGPIIILLNTVLGIHQGVKVYFSALLSFCLWPLLWNLLGSLGSEIWASYHGTSLIRVFFWLAIGVLQFSSPLFCIFLFQSFAPGAAVTKAAGHINSVTSRAPSWD